MVHRSTQFLFDWCLLLFFSVSVCHTGGQINRRILPNKVITQIFLSVFGYLFSSYSNAEIATMEFLNLAKKNKRAIISKTCISHHRAPECLVCRHRLARCYPCNPCTKDTWWIPAHWNVPGPDCVQTREPPPSPSWSRPLFLWWISRHRQNARRPISL